MNVNELINQLNKVDDKQKEIVVLSYDKGVYSKQEIKNTIEDFAITTKGHEDKDIVAIVTNKKMEENKKVKIDFGK